MTPDFMARFLEIVPIGLGSGLLAGAFGVGGGIIAVPMLRHFAGASPHVAVGCSLAVILPTAIIAVLNYLKQGKLVPKLAVVCALPAAIGTSAASAASHYVHGQLLMLLLAALMAVVGFDFATGLSHKLRTDATTEPEDFDLDRPKLVKAAVIGVAVGILSGLLGVGGGFIMVPCFCYFLRLHLKVAFGTSLIVVAIVAVPGTFVHSIHGHVKLSIVAPMLAGSLPGAWLGSYLSLKTKDRLLRIIFGVILLVLSLVFAYRELSSTI